MTSIKLSSGFIEYKRKLVARLSRLGAKLRKILPRLMILVPMLPWDIVPLLMGASLHQW